MTVLPIGIRTWTTVTVVLSVAALVYGLGTDGEPFGKFVLGSAAAAAFFLTLLLVGFRDGTVAPAPTPDDDQEVVQPPPPVVPTAPAVWPIGAALAGGVALAGLVSSAALVWIGCGLGAVVALEWMVQGWAEHATPDPEENRRLRNRIMYPFEIPALAAAGVVVVVLGFSRVLLALPEAGSTLIAIVVAAVILGVASLIAARPVISSNLVAVVAVIAGAALLGGGIAGAVVGERKVEGHGTVHAAEDVTVVAKDIAFDTPEIDMHAGETIDVTIDNQDDGIPHNIAFVGLPDSPATETLPGPSTETVAVTVEEAGEFDYICEVHPTEMTGTLVVSEAAGGEDEDGGTEGRGGE